MTTRQARNIIRIIHELLANPDRPVAAYLDIDEDEPYDFLSQLVRLAEALVVAAAAHDGLTVEVWLSDLAFDVAPSSSSILGAVLTRLADQA